MDLRPDQAPEAEHDVALAAFHVRVELEPRATVLGLALMLTVGALPPGVRMPRLSVLVYWTLPYFWNGTVYFAFLFADRLSAGTASAAAGGPFGIPSAYSLGMELALLTLLIAGFQAFGVASAMQNIRALVPEPGVWFVAPACASMVGGVFFLVAEHERRQS